MHNIVQLNFFEFGTRHSVVVGRTIFDFSFVTRPILESHFFASSRSNSIFWNQNFLNFYLSSLRLPGFFRIPQLFFWKKIKLIFSFVLTCGPNLECFYKRSSQRVLPTKPRALFCSTTSDNALSLSAGFCFFAQIKTVAGHSCSSCPNLSFGA